VIHILLPNFEGQDSGAILNIPSSKKIIPGIKAAVNGSFLPRLFFRSTSAGAGTANLLFKTDKLNCLVANYSIQSEKN